MLSMFYTGLSILLSTIPSVVCTPHTNTAKAAYQIQVNATSAKSGDAILVSWQNALQHLRPETRLNKLSELRTEWYSQNGTHMWRIIHGKGQFGQYNNSESQTAPLWIGQFSPAILSLDDVKMTGNPTPQTGTTGTPPFTTPAPVKFISGTQLSKGHWEFIVTNMVCLSLTALYLLIAS